ncbi:hypothetical protein GCK32_021424, partial [Trichostrongylus colubriformis]
MRPLHRKRMAARMGTANEHRHATTQRTWSIFSNHIQLFRVKCLHSER